MKKVLYFLYEFEVVNHVGGCQNYDPFWGTRNIRCRMIMGIQKGTIILTTTHVKLRQLRFVLSTVSKHTTSVVEDVYLHFLYPQEDTRFIHSPILKRNLLYTHQIAVI